VRNPAFITEGARRFGSQCIVVAIDAKRTGLTPSGWEVYVTGGRTPTGIDVLTWAQEAEDRRGGEILLTSMDTDGTQEGYDIPLTRAVSERVRIPVIASGGAGAVEHFAQVIVEGAADAALAASLFHYGQLSIQQVKDHLRAREIPVR
jgi:cyclase